MKIITYPGKTTIGIYSALWLLIQLVLAGNPVDLIIAKVDKSIITRSELMEASQASEEQIKKSYPPEEWDQRIREVRSQILNQMINEYVCLRYARDNKLEASEAEIEATIQNLRENAGIKSDEEFKAQLAIEGITLDELKDNLRRQTVVRRVLRNEVYSKIRVTETEIKEYYQANSEKYLTKAKIRVGVLMIDTESAGIFSSAAAEKKIKEIYEKLKSGEEFAALVKLHSDGPSRDNGGDIGFLEEGKALPIIEQTAFKLDVGNFSEPLETEFGWVIIKVLEKNSEGKKPLEEFREQIEATLREAKARNLELEWFDRQRSMTYIEIMNY